MFAHAQHAIFVAYLLYYILAKKKRPNLKNNCTRLRAIKIYRSFLAFYVKFAAFRRRKASLFFVVAVFSIVALLVIYGRISEFNVDGKIRFFTLVIVRYLLRSA